MEKRMIVGSSPHIHAMSDIPGVMRRVILALLPLVLSSVYFFGMKAVALLVVCTGVSLLSEAFFQKLRKQPLALSDGSAVITGMLLAFTLPPSFPLWAAAIGALAAIGLGKQVFGGLGYNIFNPALVGRAFLQASFPVLITTWTPPLRSGLEIVDAATQATPLAAMKFQHALTPYLDLFLGGTGGSLGETSTLVVLVGGLFLILIKDADYRIVAGIFGGALFFSGLLWIVAPQHYADPLFHLLSGGFMLGSFFMATDMVTSPVTPTGRWIFGIGIGLLIILIRSFSGLPEGVMYSILLMNALAPLIDSYTRPHVFGELKKEATS